MKLAIAAIIYVLAFVAHLVPIHVLRHQRSYAEWQDTWKTFGVSPLPGTEALVSTLQGWWVYPLVGVFVFGYWLVYRKKLLAPTLFMVALALVWWVYLYGPAVALGRVV